MQRLSAPRRPQDTLIRAPGRRVAAASPAPAQLARQLHGAMSPWGPKPENPIQGKGLYPPQLAETAARGCAAFRVLAFRVTFGGVALRSAGPPSGRVVTAGPALGR